MIRGHEVIAIEEHYWDPEVAATAPGYDAGRVASQTQRLADFTGVRLAEMDAAGIDIQVISHGAPSVQRMEGREAVGLARRANDRLAAQTARRPDRLRAFAMLPTNTPEAAADELERCVRDHRFCGAMLHGLSAGRFLDEEDFRPIFARAEALDTPIYLHPATPDERVTEAYYAAYAKSHPMVIRPAWGFAVETATLAIRLILSGVFEAHPRLQIILGHMGEMLPFQLWRLDQALKRPGNAAVSFGDTFRRHFHVTTSGHFSTPALACAMAELGPERVMFSVDWPFVANEPAVAWAQGLDLPEPALGGLLGANARRLLKLA